jgi:hypothetical protein
MRVNIYAWDSYLYSTFLDAAEEGDYDCISRYVEKDSQEYLSIMSALNNLVTAIQGQSVTLPRLKFHEELFATDKYWYA